jgi:adenylosuccinate lyase
MNVYELADALEKIETYNQVIHRSFNDKTKLTASADILRQQADRIAELEEILDACQRQRDAWRNFAELFDKERKTTPQIKELSDEELNKAFDYYCETDEGVLRFNYELRDEWKKEQLIRWKEAFKKASEK